MIKKTTNPKVLLFICLCLFCACKQSKYVHTETISETAKKSETSIKYDSSLIIADLLSKANRFDSYAQDYVFQGRTVKRMSFLFKKDGKDFYTYRTDYNENGVKLIRLFNVEGKYDYEYYPDKKIAFRRPTQVTWNEANYAKAKDQHFNFDEYEVIGEKQVNGKDCYILESKESVITVWKENGLKTSLNDKDSNKPPLAYDNFEFNLSEEMFAIPDDTEIKE